MNHYHLTLITKRNQDCLFCLVKGEPEINLSFKDAISKLKKARQQGAIFLSIDGGEPTLLPYFKKLIKQSISLGFKKVVIKTNGWGFSNYDFAKAVLLNNQHIIRINLSLHGPNAEIHDYLAQTSGSFKIAIKAARNITKLQGDLVANIVICSQNYKFLLPYINLIEKLKIKEVILLFIASRGNALKNTFLIPKIENTIPFVRQAISYADSKGIYLALTFFPFCLLDNYSLSHAVEFHISSSIELFDELAKERYKSKKCQSCKYYDKCPGVWKEYYKLKGFQFKPIK
jgi:MoaA/NifB/PqqE/SkfB family radical SAM enzyme